MHLLSCLRRIKAICAAHLIEDVLHVDARKFLITSHGTHLVLLKCSLCWHTISSKGAEEIGQKYPIHFDLFGMKVGQTSFVNIKNSTFVHHRSSELQYMTCSQKIIAWFVRFGPSRIACDKITAPPLQQNVPLHHQYRR